MPAPPTAARDLRVIVLVGAAHFTSHFLQLALPPLFPLIRDDLGLSYVSLGFVVTLFYAASGTSQFVSGFVVNRVGARPVLLAGMALLAVATALAGASGWFGLLAGMAVLAGLGNGVFHPADYSLLGVLVDRRRAGRAYSAHQLAGMLGYAAGPPVVVALAAFGGWRAALAVSGALGLAATAVVGAAGAVLGGHRPAARATGAVRGALGKDFRLLLTVPLLSAFAYFAVFATAQIGFQTFAVTALGRIYDVPLTVVTGVLTAFLLASAVGVIAGGLLVNRIGHAAALVTGGLVLGAAVQLTLWGSTLAPLALTALAAAGGFCLGFTSPARDLMIRATVPVAASGKVFGFAYAGLDVGAAVAPPLFGWLVDRGQPRAVFAIAAMLLALTCVTLAGLRGRRVGLVRGVTADPA